MRYSSLFSACILFAAYPAFSQDYSGLESKIDRLERDMTFLQRQVYKGDPNSTGASTVTASTPVGAAASVQFTQVQEDLRALRGQIEQLEYRIRTLETNQTKRDGDMEYRLQQLEQRATAPIAAAEPVDTDAPTITTPSVASPKAPIAPKVVSPHDGYDVNASDPAAARKSAPTNEEIDAAAAGKGFTTAREHYNYAFKQLNDGKYADASASFTEFVAKYPKDTLVPNAYYWMGESYYARKDFTRAAAGFRKGYEAAPKGQKSADNLLKLSLSLSNLKRKDEACIVLKQIIAQYSDSQKATAAKADKESVRLGCV
jgi:tol-pal system protein YbgF